MKIPIQEKIAELESRVAKLETRMAALEKSHGVVYYQTAPKDPVEFESHWTKMWKEFNLAFKAMFG